MALTIKQIEAAKPQKKKYKLPDGEALSLQVLPSGVKSFIYRYRRPTTKKENILTYGQYPDLSLKDAREMHRQARELLARGVDPGEAKKQLVLVHAGQDTFESIAREWYSKFSMGWSPSHAKTVIDRLEANVFPYIGDVPISDLNAQNMLTIVQRIHARGAVEVARRTRGICSQVFRYAIVLGKADRDPAADVTGALPPASQTGKHFAALIIPKDVGALLRAIDDYQGTPVVRAALKLSPLVFLRPGEIRKAEWAEIDIDAAEWRIPPEKMKKRRPHIIPLSRQAIDIFKEIYPLTKGRQYIFPGARSPSRPMSENTITAAIRRMGFEKDQMCAHGFRGMATTLLLEQGWPEKVVDLQLAHKEKNKVRAAYDHATHLEARRKMMQAWADYLDQLREE